VKTYTLLDNLKSRSMIIEAIMNAEPGIRVTIGESPRSIKQNACMWGILDCFAKQAKWNVNGELVRMDSESWKDLLTASFTMDAQRIAESFDDPDKRVLLGVHTRNFGKAQFIQWIEYLHFAAALLNVDLSFRYEERQEPTLDMPHKGPCVPSISSAKQEACTTLPGRQENVSNVSSGVQK
jgi:hypothetical protein